MYIEITNTDTGEVERLPLIIIFQTEEVDEDPDPDTD